jgi:8-oxo-dGTP pyrophosphatase MutT (NUDIX family)
MGVEPKPSATVVLIRDGEEHLELLLLERNTLREEKRGPWVFPGGKIEPADCAGPTQSMQQSARFAAVREAEEEAGIRLDVARLIPISRWITPEISPKRFDTWFFLGCVGSDHEVRVDGGEIRAHRWLTPREALEAHASGEIRLAPPTFVTVNWLLSHATTEGALRSLGREPIPTFRPRVCPRPEGVCILYAGDAGYDEGAVERAGARHRLWMAPDGWRYERNE